MKTKKLTFMALLLAIALTLFVVEAHLPPIVPVQGVKLGLANIVTLLAIVWLGRREAAVLLIMRIVLGSIFTGQAVSFIYSLCGGLLCLLVMCAAFGFMGTRRLWVISVFGAIAHNIGQIGAAVFMTSTWRIVYYLPVLLISAVLTGTFTGLTAQLLTKYIHKENFK